MQVERGGCDLVYVHVGSKRIWNVRVLQKTESFIMRLKEERETSF